MTPLLLLPGTLCDERVWAPVRDAWASATGEGRRDIRTAALEGRRSAAAMASALLECMPDRCAIAGFSLGGIVALEMAAQAPDRVLGLALVASNARPDPPENAASRRAAVHRARSNGIESHVRDELLCRYFGSAHAQDRALQDLVCRMAVDTGLDAYLAQSDIASNRSDSRPRLRDIVGPTLVVGGDEDGINPPDRQEEMARALPCAEWHQVKHAGHFVPLEAPAELAELMALWLHRVDAERDARLSSQQPAEALDALRDERLRGR
ncbi:MULTISPECIES: alpha/beta fold hydrolase [unclassified Variovorax]|uniref:alpha/beta fold hydrolase n=1 Tax=unclassified Variovorax TaxID=663243 RepID=UPI0025764A61|nr:MULTISPECIES: alpha/beta fold hydrolase [unclassified Variovorax]MDM0089211.1 alpha/beta fold hydrolase [Variovorax sp. J22G40]MDM0147284.1 alpha/beta fold hydrolase [Variovorax sp. J2P1-31]